MKKLVPKKGHVILKPIAEGERQSGRIIIPDIGNEKPILAEVIEVSEGSYNWRTDKIIPLETKVGEIVIVPKMGALVITIENQEYYICQADQLSVYIIDNVES